MYIKHCAINKPLINFMVYPLRLFRQNQSHSPEINLKHLHVAGMKPCISQKVDASRTVPYQFYGTFQGPIETYIPIFFHKRGTCTKDRFYLICTENSNLGSFRKQRVYKSIL
jgi:hypothetical protein